MDASGDAVSVISLLFALAERANALNHGFSLLFRELTFKAGHNLPFRFLLSRELLIGMRLLPVSFGEIGLS